MMKEEKMHMIRKAGKEDRERIQQLTELLESQQFNTEDFEKIYLDQLNDERYVCFVYETEEGILSFLNMRMEAQLHHNAKVAQILELVTEENRRSQGIGRELFLYACDYAEKNGCVQIELETSLWRRRAHAFYEREGMTADHAYYTKKL